ncbi:MAG: hypothetical protein WBD55_06465 [Dehalococcoidia bacterium]
MKTPLDFVDFKDLLRDVWPGASPAEVTADQTSHHGHADHWRLRRGDKSFVLRVTNRAPNAQRILIALDALEGETFAPRLYGWRGSASTRFLIAMEDIPGDEPDIANVQRHLGQLLAVIQRLHRNERFQRAVATVGRGPTEDSSRHWADEEWRHLQGLAPDDERVRRAARWLERVHRTGERHALADSIMVSGHGDLHRANWRLPTSGPVLLDWEEIRCWPLASELADFIVFGDLSPSEMGERYGVPSEYAEAIEDEAAACALSFYLYWLRTLIDGSDPRPLDVAFVERVCERLFAG